MLLIIWQPKLRFLSVYYFPFWKNNDFHSSEEHRKHSPKCEFLLLNKKEEDWTVQEFLELETKRQMNVMVIIWKKFSS